MGVLHVRSILRRSTSNHPWETHASRRYRVSPTGIAAALAYEKHAGLSGECDDVRLRGKSGSRMSSGPLVTHADILDAVQRGTRRTLRCSQCSFCELADSQMVDFRTPAASG